MAPLIFGLEGAQFPLDLRLCKLQEQESHYE